MQEEDFKNIKGITIISAENYYTYGFTMSKWEFIPKKESGEMASIRWIEVWKDDKKIAYLPMSACIITFI